MLAFTADFSLIKTDSTRNLQELNLSRTDGMENGLFLIFESGWWPKMAKKDMSEEHVNAPRREES